jgi:hypothetical protein
MLSIDAGTASARRAAVRLLCALCCLLIVTACDETPTGPTVGFNQQVTLAPGETARIAGSTVQLQFVDVTGDSRCPADAFCIQGGDAVVRIRASGGGAAATYDLHTGDASRAAASHGDVRFALSQLMPYPFSGRTIARQDYRATLEISRP